MPQILTDAKGKQRRAYRWYATPWEILRQIPDLARHLRPEITASDLERMANAQSGAQAARSMQEAKRKMFAELRRKGREARENDGYGNDGPTAPARRGKVENQKQVSHFPTCCPCS